MSPSKQVLTLLPTVLPVGEYEKSIKEENRPALIFVGAAFLCVVCICLLTPLLARGCPRRFCCFTCDDGGYYCPCCCCFCCPGSCAWDPAGCADHYDLRGKRRSCRSCLGLRPKEEDRGRSVV